MFLDVFNEDAIDALVADFTADLAFGKFSALP
jgi:hypothetical protein